MLVIIIVIIKFLVWNDTIYLLRTWDIPLTPLILFDFQSSSLSETLLFPCKHDKSTKLQDHYDHLGHYGSLVAR